MDALVESVTVTGLILLPLLALTALAFIADRIADRHYHRNHRPVETLHDFDDWREPAADFFHARFASHTRTRLAIAATCGADPDKNEGRDVVPSGPVTSKENHHAGKHI